LNIKKVYKGFQTNEGMTYYTNPLQGNILFGIERRLEEVRARPKVVSELATLLSVARDLSSTYGVIPMQLVESLEQDYYAIRAG